MVRSYLRAVYSVNHRLGGARSLPQAAACKTRMVTPQHDRPERCHGPVARAGIAVVIVLDQIPKLLGVHIATGNFVHNLAATLQAVPHASLPTLAVGIVMIVLLIGVAHFFPKAPAPLIVVAIGIAGVRLFGLQNWGVETVGQIPQGLPSFTPPDLSLVARLWPAALGIALMSFTETIAAARAFATGEEPHLRPNQELAVTGIANVGGALFGGMPAGGGTLQARVRSWQSWLQQQ
jgi:sulfate permease, SulP family